MWTEQDRAEVLALAQWRAQLCPCGCGYESADTLSMEPDPGEPGIRFFATKIPCRARLALLEEQEAATTDKTRHPGARLWRIHMRKG